MNNLLQKFLKSFDWNILNLNSNFLVFHNLSVLVGIVRFLKEKQVIFRSLRVELVQKDSIIMRSSKIEINFLSESISCSYKAADLNRLVLSSQKKTMLYVFIPA